MTCLLITLVLLNPQGAVGLEVSAASYAGQREVASEFGELTWTEITSGAQTWTYTYDNMNRLVDVLNPTTGHDTYLYDDIALASAVETEIVSAGLFLHMDVLDRGVDDSAARTFGLKFVRDKDHRGVDQYAAMMQGDEFILRPAYQLYAFAGELAKAFETPCEWPEGVYESLAAVRNRLVHNQMRPLSPGGRQPFAIGPQGEAGWFVAQAEACFATMRGCLACLHDIHSCRNIGDPDHAKRFARAMSALSVKLKPETEWPPPDEDILLREGLLS